MPTFIFSSLLFNNQHHHQHHDTKSQQQQECCCTCQCNHHNKEPSTTITRWFPRIRRRSSSSTSSTVSYNDDSIVTPTTPSQEKQEQTHLDYITEIEDNKQIEQFIKLYDLAVDEMDYAIESQGSIYYDGDLLTATEAVDGCLSHFRDIMQTLTRDKSHQLQQKWTDTLFELRSRLDDLPCPSTITNNNNNSDYYYY